MTILITGFSAFPGAPENPTEALVRSLAGARTQAGEAIATAVLPVDWERSWPALDAAVAAERPRAVLMFGLHARAERLRIELVARNHRELGRQDAAGGFPSGPAILDGPERLTARLPLAEIAEGLRGAGIDFEWSRNAGGYLCNDSFYRLAFHAQRHGIEWHGFVHTPLSDELIARHADADGLPEVFCSVSGEVLRRAALAIADAVPPVAQGQDRQATLA